jgi:hypothetical protein
LNRSLFSDPPLRVANSAILPVLFSRAAAAKPEGDPPLAAKNVGDVVVKYCEGSAAAIEDDDENICG